MVFVLLSPAKTMAFDRPRPKLIGEVPHFQKQAAEIAAVMKKMTPSKIGKLMDISEKLSVLNVERYKAFSAKPKDEQTDLAIVAFQGDTYVGFDAKTLTDAQLKDAHKYVGMLSGLYGVLQPLDLIQPYRLEMGTSVSIDGAKNLYGYWDAQITDRINALVKKHKHKAVIGCASNEYLSSVQTNNLDAPFINCDFKETKNGKVSTVGIFAKRARGMMARYIVENKIADPEALKKFNGGKYKFDKSLSDDANFVFVR